MSDTATLARVESFGDLGYFTVVARRQCTKAPCRAELEAAMQDIVATAPDLINDHGFFQAYGTPVADDAHGCNALYVSFANQSAMIAFMLRKVPQSAFDVTMEYRLTGSAVFM